MKRPALAPRAQTSSLSCCHVGAASRTAVWPCGCPGRDHAREREPDDWPARGRSEAGPSKEKEGVGVWRAVFGPTVTVCLRSQTPPPFYNTNDQNHGLLSFHAMRAPENHGCYRCRSPFVTAQWFECAMRGGRCLSSCSAHARLRKRGRGCVNLSQASTPRPCPRMRSTGCARHSCVPLRWRKA